MFYNKVYYFFNSLACSIYLSISIAWYERKYLSLIVVYAWIASSYLPCFYQDFSSLQQVDGAEGVVVGFWLAAFSSMEAALSSWPSCA